MTLLSKKLVYAGALAAGTLCASAQDVAKAGPDPCAKVGGQKWVAPADLRACFNSFPVDQTIKSNIIDVINKTLAFHTSTNYEIQAPPPFDKDVHENVLADLARIQGQTYKSDYDLHIDLSRTLKRLNDGHCVWVNNCYDSLFLNFLPIPLVLLTDANGDQDVHIAPTAFEVAKTEFADEIQVWQNALEGDLKGKLESLSGAKVVKINGEDPFKAVDANAAIIGSFQGLGTRQNSFFSSYNVAATGWLFVMGNFAQQSLPLDDNVSLTLQLTNSSTVDVKLPYRSRIGDTAVPFLDSASFRKNNCVAGPRTNGVDLNDVTIASLIPPVRKPKHLIDALIDKDIVVNVVLPPVLQPSDPLPTSSRVAQFYLLDAVTGVLALGSFADDSYELLLDDLLKGLVDLKDRGATRLIVDVTNNGGGYICIAHFLHRAIVGPKDTTVPQAGLDTKVRAGPLAQKIVDALVSDPSIDSDVDLLYNPRQYRDANNNMFGPMDNWLQPVVNVEINGRKDMFSPRIGQECQPDEFTSEPPAEALFDGANVVIVNNGRCASSCSLFTVTMAKEEGSKTVVLGGKKGVNQQYCGTVGGQSTAFPVIDTDIKTTHLKNDSLAPPDLLVNGVQGITWRLGFGVRDTQAPEEWQDHSATFNLPLTAESANNPQAIWEEVVKLAFTN